ncbi:MAG: succinylglutamate desuccinylase/aspartoacylase family protein [Patescibacteria group bacterium]
MKNIQIKKLSIGKLGVIDLNLPYLVIGKRKPRGLILGLQHGGETSSLEIISKFIENKVNGQAIIVPTVNPFGLLFGTRNEPLDGKDLNRNYPGKENGDLAQRICSKIFSLAKSCDFVIDLHSFSNRLTKIVCGFTEIGDGKIKEKILKMIKVINPDFIWKINLKDKNDRRFCGTLDEVIIKSRIPAIFIEMPNLQFISEIQTKKVVEGLINIFKKFNQKTQIKKDFSILSAQYIFADQSGLFIPKVFPKEEIKISATIGEVLVLPDFKKIKIKSLYSGVIISILSKSFIRLGTKLASIGKMVGNI